jgi:hypothetical protein
MRETRTSAQEAAEDVFFGQAVMIWARWFLIAGSLILALWTVDSVAQVVIGTLPIVGLMAMNFYLHGRYLAGRPANPVLIGMASLLDLAAITIVVLLWPGHRGLESQFFVMYYPIVLAFAFVMPRKAAIAYTVAALGAYTGACVIGGISSFTGPDGTGVDMGSLEVLVMRLITLAAMGGLGTYYWRIQRNRRRSATDGTSVVQADPVGA